MDGNPALLVERIFHRLACFGDFPISVSGVGDDGIEKSYE
jgi:hypothetical protein